MGDIDMFGFFKKKESADRKAMREEFEEHIRVLRHTDDATKMAVGYGINIANSMFIKRYGSVKAFSQQPMSEKINYIHSLNEFETKMSDQDPLFVVGASLFKKWIAALIEEDKELMSQFSKELDYFSRKGDINF